MSEPAGLHRWRGFTAQPEDVLFFRDSRPSALGVDHYLSSIFPPLPSTIYGMLRTCRLADAGCNLDRLGEKNWADLPAEVRSEVGEWGKLGTLRLRGPWLVRGDEILLPAPADLGLLPGPSGTAESTVRYLPVASPARGGWSHPLSLLEAHAGSIGAWTRVDDLQPIAAGDRFITTAGIAQWLAGGIPEPSTFVEASTLWTIEQRVGVGLQAGRRASEDGRLYSFGFIRLLPGVSIGFELCGSAINPGVTAVLGGEGRLVHLRERPGLSELIAEPRGGRMANSLYLATPAIFGGAVASTPVTPTVTAAAVKSMTYAGGWDLAKKAPKPLRRAVPAGSVYFTGEDVASFMQVSEGHEEGFGVVLAGVY